MKIPIDSIRPNPQQPRKAFDQAELEDLKNSILQYDLIQPIVVEESPEGGYVLIDGERRWRACKMAGKIEVECVVRASSNGNGERERLSMAIIANVQRSNLGPVEEARAYKALMDQGMTGRDISVKLGIRECVVYNRVTLLELDPPILKMVEQGKFSCLPEAARAIKSIPDSNARAVLVEKLVARGLGKNKSAIENSVNQLNKRLQGQKPYRDDQSPAAELAQKKAPVDLAKWDIIYQAGKAPPWGIIYQAALDACAACQLRPAASETTCRNCAAADMLKRMIEKGTQEQARRMARKALDYVRQR